MQQIRDLVNQSVSSIEHLYERRGAVLGLYTGFPAFDDMIDGLQASDLIVIAGPLGVGKTSFAVNIVDHVATAGRHGVAMFSGGMNGQQLVRRLICARSGVELRRVQTGMLNKSNFPSLALAASKLAESPIFIDDTTRLSITEVRKRVETAKNEYDIKLAVIDDLRRLYAAERKVCREDRTTETLIGLKSIAHDLQLPVLALAKLPKEVRPGDHNNLPVAVSREAEDIEDYADVVGLLERPELHGEIDDKRRKSAEKATLRIVKNRTGSLGEINLRFLRGCLRFESIS